VWIGAAFVSLSAISKELQMGVLHCAPIEGLSRTLWLIFNPNRYRSEAAEAFSGKFYPSLPQPDGARRRWSRHRYKQML